jgi:hypothetical protein
MFEFGVEWYHIFFIGIVIGIAVTVLAVFISAVFPPVHVTYIKIVEPFNPFV